MILYNEQGEPANLSASEASWLVEVPYDVWTRMIQEDYYYMNIHKHHRKVYIINPYKEWFLEMSGEHYIQWKGTQSMWSDKQKTYEPVVFFKNMLVKGYKELHKAFQIEEDELSSLYIDNFLKRYCYFGESQVQLMEGKFVKKGKTASPIMWLPLEDKVAQQGFYGYSGLKRMFPYTNTNTLYKYYNSKEHYWKAEQTSHHLSAQEIITKYGIKTNYESYYSDSLGLSVTTIRELVKWLREQDEVINEKTLGDLPRLLNKPKKVDWLIDKYNIRLSPMGNNQTYFDKDGETQRLTSKNKLRQEFSLSPKQLHEMWETLEDNSSLHS